MASKKVTRFTMTDALHTFAFNWNSRVPDGAVYIDGTQGTPGTKSNFGTASITGTYLGRRSNTSYAGSYFQGKILSVRLYSTKLTASQIASNRAIDSERFEVPSPTTHTLTLSDCENGSITADPATGPYEDNAEVTLTATSASGYHFAGWTGDATGTENPLTITMDADKTIGAIFEQDVPEPPPGPHEIPETMQVVEWVQGGGAQDGAYVATGIKAQDKLTAVLDFTPVTITRYGSFAGAYDSASPQIRYYPAYCNLSGQWQYYAQNKTTGTSLEAGTAAVGIEYLITNNYNGTTYKWSLNGAAPITKTVTALPTASDLGSRNPEIYLFGYRNSGSATVTNAVKFHSAQFYTNSTLSAQNEIGGVLARDFVPVYDTTTLRYGFFDRVTGEFFGSASATELTGPSVAPTTHALTLNVCENGTITADPATGPYEEGSTVTLTATANSGFHFTGWTGDATGTENPLAVTMDSDKTIGATFEEDSPTPPPGPTPTPEPYAIDEADGWSKVVDGEIVVAFTNVNKTHAFTVPNGVSKFVYLVVGGGGGGGGGGSSQGGCGGGGGGGVASNAAPYAVVAGSTLTITVGAGGAAGAGASTGNKGLGGDGGESNILIGDVEIAKVLGGGGGAGGNLSARSTGANGGGGSAKSVTGGTGVNGYNGGSGNGTTNKKTGGGGAGAGADGDAPVTSGTRHAGNGGDGVYSMITGEAFCYGGGGGGGKGDTGSTAYDPGLGGAGGGGAGGTGSNVGNPGTDGLGGGGGGVGNSGSKAGGKGGDGIVIIRYAASSPVPSSGLMIYVK